MTIFFFFFVIMKMAWRVKLICFYCCLFASAFSLRLTRESKTYIYFIFYSLIAPASRRVDKPAVLYIRQKKNEEENEKNKKEKSSSTKSAHMKITPTTKQKNNLWRTIIINFFFRFRLTDKVCLHLAAASAKYKSLK